MLALTPPDVTAYFWHIPKTAGSSVKAWLGSRFGDSLCPASIADELVRLPATDLHLYRAFAGHFHCYLAPYLGRQMVSFTVLRDPVDRTRSHWHQIRRHLAHPYHKRVITQSFAEFVDDDVNRVMIEDYQARYLASLPIDMAALSRAFSNTDRSRYALAEALELASLPITKDFLATSARETLGTMAVVGVCEQLMDFLGHVSRVLGISRPQVEPRMNVTEGDRAGLPVATLARLHNLTRLDQELYDEARRGRYPPMSAL